MKNKVALFDLPRSHLFVAPPSGLLLVLTKVDGCLCFNGFDCVDCWLDVFVGSFCSVRPVAKLFWGYCLFAIEKLEGIELSSS